MSAPAMPRRPSPASMPRRVGTPPGAAQPSSQHQPAPDTFAQPVPQAPPVPDVPKERPRPGDSLTPGVLHRRERLRPLFQQAMRISRLLPNSRLVALTLLGYTHYESGLIRRHPTTAELAYATGLSKGQVLTQVEILTQRGWLRTKPLPVRAGVSQLAPQLCIPAPVLDQIRARAHHNLPPA